MPEKGLKKGFTTGAAAAAAAKAALSALLTGNDPPSVTISFLTGEKKILPVHSVQKLTETRCRAVIIKDAGDDPDVTHKARIGAVVTVTRDNRAAGTRILITGGKGVGTITKPGLELPVGEPAINPGPRTMIRNEIEDVLQTDGRINGTIEVEVFVPMGEILAKKTLNARLGITGGISILGTTGVVTPMSHDAYIATIKAGIGVAAANGADTLVFTTGRRSERFAMGIFERFSPDIFIQTGDFFKASLDMVGMNSKIKTIIYTIFFGKAVKMALGFEHTHAAKSELTLKELARWAVDITGKEDLGNRIRSANTARHAFEFIHPEHPDLLTCVGEKIVENAMLFSGNALSIRAIILDFNGRVAYDSAR